MNINQESAHGPVSQAEREPGRRRTIVVPLDGTQRSISALPVARALAELEGATLHVVHVSERARPVRDLVRELGLPREAIFNAVVDELVGDPASQIVEIAHREPGSHIVICAHSADVGPGEELGPVTQAVLSHARGPVILVRPESAPNPWRLERVLLPHDGSPTTASAFPPAVRLGARARASMFVLHVATLLGQPPEDTLPVPPYVDQPQHEWPEWTREFLERMEVFSRFPEAMQPRLFLSRGDPGDEILRFAAERDIDLIALGWRGDLDSEHARTVKKLLLNAPCPVLFQRIEDGRRWLAEEEPPKVVH